MSHRTTRRAARVRLRAAALELRATASSRERRDDEAAELLARAGFLVRVVQIRPAPWWTASHQAGGWVLARLIAVADRRPVAETSRRPDRKEEGGRMTKILSSIFGRELKEPDYNFGCWEQGEETITVSEPQPFGGWAVRPDGERGSYIAGYEVPETGGWFGCRELTPETIEVSEPQPWR